MSERIPTDELTSEAVLNHAIEEKIAIKAELKETRATLRELWRAIGPDARKMLAHTEPMLVVFIRRILGNEDNAD